MHQPSPGGERVRHHTRQRDWHKGACGGRGGTLWVVALTGRGLDSPKGTLIGLEWQGLAPLAPLTVLPGPLRWACPVQGQENLRAG